MLLLMMFAEPLKYIERVSANRARSTATTAVATTFFNHLINSKINYVQSNCSVMFVR